MASSTMTHSKSLKSPFSLILSLNFELQQVNALLDICVNKQIGVPNKVASEHVTS